MRRRLVGWLAALAAIAAGTLSAVAAPAATTTAYGYLAMSDGTQLRWSVVRPAAPGRYPVAMNYDGYCAGTGATGCNDRELAGDLLTAGYAVVGVSVRGTGCSTGTFDFRAPEESADGAAAVSWAARQPWANGRVGLFGDSFPGLTQPGVAALRPAGLAAIAPFQIVDDVYQDVGHPGGIENTEFGAFWGLGDQPVSAAQNPFTAVTQQNDPGCATNYATGQPSDAQSNIFLTGRQHPYRDAYWDRKAVAGVSRITVPVLGCLTWQDDEVGSRASESLFRKLDPRRLWLIASNGNHGLCDQTNPTINHQVVRFFDRFVRGSANGFDSTPHVQIWHEAYATSHTDVGVAHVQVISESHPSWVSTFAAWPKTVATPMFLRAGGALATAPASAAETADTYAAPAPSAGTEDGVVVGQQNRLWAQPVPPGGAVVWTSPRLRHDVENLGPASADLWLSSSGTDTDVQVTVTEVRPDGQETYVARGWLRASDRRIDGARSTETRPEHPYREADVQALTPGKPELLRVQVFPFDHVFRAGSAIRIIVDTPSQTGGWNFDVLPTPVTNAVLHDAAHASRVVFSVLPGARAAKPLPACNTVLNQPCRSDAYPGDGR